MRPALRLTELLYRILPFSQLDDLNRKRWVSKLGLQKMSGRCRRRWRNNEHPFQIRARRMTVEPEMETREKCKWRRSKVIR